ncbi:MAG: GNAT family N-acetyltransferase [Candidatus Kapaibacterium sp.]
MNSEIKITTDKNKLDIEFINSFISKSYWAKGRTLENMKVIINNSLNFGVFLNDFQIGYARVVTDYGQFGYLMDVFITEVHQGKGYSKILMDFIMNYPDLEDVKVWRLATSDAHKLYEKYGFKQLKNPEKLMELIK